MAQSEIFTNPYNPQVWNCCSRPCDDFGMHGVSKLGHINVELSLVFLWHVQETSETPIGWKSAYHYNLWTIVEARVWCSSPDIVSVELDWWLWLVILPLRSGILSRPNVYTRSWIIRNQVRLIRRISYHVVLVRCFRTKFTFVGWSLIFTYEIHKPCEGEDWKCLTKSTEKDSNQEPCKDRVVDENECSVIKYSSEFKINTSEGSDMLLTRYSDHKIIFIRPIDSRSWQNAVKTARLSDG